MYDLSADRYSRQVLFRGIGPEGQGRIRAAEVLVVGCGALGTHTAEYLARAGVGALHLVDRDLVEWSNLQRQIGYLEEDAREGAPKAPALAAHLRRVNSEVRIAASAVEFNFHNALELAEGKSLLIDGTDNLLARFLLNDVACRLGIPWVYAGAVEATGLAQAFSGTKGPCLRCVLGDLPPPGSLATCDTAGVIGPAAAAVASWQAAMALRILAAGGADAVVGRLVQLDLWDLEAHVVHVLADPRCPACAEGRYEFLSGAYREESTLLCGRAAVQVSPPAPAPAFNLDAAAERLRPLGSVERKPHCVRWTTSEFTATIFPDGRAIFHGLTDPGRARSLYARYLGG